MGKVDPELIEKYPEDHGEVNYFADEDTLVEYIFNAIRCLENSRYELGKEYAHRRNWLHKNKLDKPINEYALDHPDIFLRHLNIRIHNTEVNIEKYRRNLFDLISKGMKERTIGLIKTKNMALLHLKSDNSIIRKHCEKLLKEQTNA